MTTGVTTSPETIAARVDRVDAERVPAQQAHSDDRATTWKFGISDPGTGRAASRDRASSAEPDAVEQPDRRPREHRAPQRDLDVRAEQHRERRRRSRRQARPTATTTRRSLEQPPQPLVRPAPVVDRRGVVDLHAVRRRKHAAARLRGFIGDIAEFMGLNVPYRWQRPENFVNRLKSMNGGRQMVRLSAE